MMEEAEKLIELAYSFFPKGVSDNEESYFKSKEFKKLQMGLLKKMEYLPKVEEIVSHIKLNDSTVVFENINPVFPHDRCIKGKLYFSNQTSNNYLVFYISVLIPFYVIYECLYDNSLTSKEILQKKFIQKNISGTYLPLYKIIEEGIKKHFPKYSLMNEELFYSEVPDIVFNGNGKLDYFNSKFTRPMTLFNVFFSDNYF